VTLPTRAGRRKRRGIVVHRSSLAADEVTRQTHIPVTTPARTLVDLADVLPRRALERAIDQAEYLRLDLGGLVPRHGRPGSGVLCRVLADHRAGSTLTRSELEERFLTLHRAGELPRPVVNARVAGYEVDFLWQAERLIVETDGHAAHGTRAAFERDRLRDAELTALGYRVVRITYRRLVREPNAVREQLRRLLVPA
jgi:very-short-patch-repair endonuclease